MKKSILLFSMFFLFIFLTGCVKDMDFEKYENPQVSTLYRTPIGNVQLSQTEYDIITTQTLTHVDTLIMDGFADWDFSKVEKATLTFTMINGFPFPIDSCAAYFTMNNGGIIDTVHTFYIGKVSAATIKTDGTLLSSSQASKIDTFDYDQFQVLVKSNQVSLHYTIPIGKKPITSSTFFQSAYIHGDLLVKLN